MLTEAQVQAMERLLETSPSLIEREDIHALLADLLERVDAS